MANYDFVKVGSIGTRVDEPWDEKGHTNIVQMFIWHDDEGIAAVQFQYMENGRLVMSPCHGTPVAAKFDIVKLNYPSEHVTSISGSMISCSDGVIALKFSTNCGEYGPFGNAKYLEVASCFQVNEQFGGFYGTVPSLPINTRRNIASIGVYLKPTTTTQPGNQTANKSNFRVGAC